MAGLTLLQSAPRPAQDGDDPRPSRRRAPQSRASQSEQGLPRLVLDAVLRSYAQVLFSRSRLVGGVLVAATFLSPRVGLAGLAAAALAAGLGLLLRLPRTDLREGLYGYNAMLVGLGVGALFEPGGATAAVLLLGVAAAVLATAAARSMLTGVLALPVLTVPFVGVLWLLVASAPSIGLRRALPASADPFTGALGTTAGALLDSFGALFFQPAPLAGALVLVAMLLASRIGTALAVGGFAVAWVMSALLLDPAHASLHLTLGFNLALVAWALGGTWFVPGLGATAFGLGAAAVTGLVTLGLAPLCAAMDMPVGILPFNLVVLGGLVAMRQRTRDGAPWAVDFLPGSPEDNLRHHRTRVARFGSIYGLRLHAPFMGAWVVTQGEDGAHTHKGDWRSAFDFEVEGPDQRRFKGDGSRNEDHLCWRLPVLSPAHGTVVHVVDGLPDTAPGAMDLQDNWGNAVVVQHAVGLYSVVAHLAQGSVRVRPGQMVQQGEELGRCGASGRSPVPHLHYQLQASPVVGAPTLTTELHDVIEVGEDGDLVLHGTLRPDEGTRLRNVAVDDSVSRLLRLPLGHPLHFEIEGPGSHRRTEVLVPEVGLTGGRRLRSPRLDATLFYTPGERLWTVHDATGSGRSVVHLLHAALPRMPYEVDPRMTWTDTLPHHAVAGPALATLLDLVLPFVPGVGVQMRYRAEWQDSALVVQGESLRRHGDAPLLQTRAVLRPNQGPAELSLTLRGQTTTARRFVPSPEAP